MEAFLLSTGVIFLAELGDKSQLMAMTFATRFKARTVLLGITIATALVQAFSVLVGAVMGDALPTDVVSVLADALAIGVGVWLGRQLPEKVVRYGAAAAFAVFGVLLVVDRLTR